MKRLVVFLTLTLAAASLSAQQPGDSVRIRGVQGTAAGRLLALDYRAVTLQEGTTQRTLRPVLQFEVWRPRNHAVDIAVSAVVFGLLATQMHEDPLLGAGVGAMLGVGTALVWPGRWSRVVMR